MGINGKVLSLLRDIELWMDMHRIITHILRIPFYEGVFFFILLATLTEKFVNLSIRVNI